MEEWGQVGLFLPSLPISVLACLPLSLCTPLCLDFYPLGAQSSWVPTPQPQPLTSAPTSHSKYINPCLFLLFFLTPLRIVHIYVLSFAIPLQSQGLDLTVLPKQTEFFSHDFQ